MLTDLGIVLKTLALITCGSALMLAALVLAFLSDPLTKARLIVDVGLYGVGAVLLAWALYRIWDRLLQRCFPSDEIR